MAGSLASHVALVTGGGRGIGRATAVALAAAGCDVVVVARTASEVEATAAAVGRHGVRALALTADLADAEQLDRVAEQATALGPISILINNAGSASGRRPHARMSPSDWTRTLAVCLEAPLRLCRTVLPDMLARHRGCIVNVGSTAALRPRAGEAVYAAAKAGLLAFSRALYAEVRDHGVKVIAVMPGYVDTAFVPPNRRVDRGKFLQPDDVAAAIVAAVASPTRACPTEIVLEPLADPEGSGGRQ
ncbi:SDR family oxidoreductase [Candidatus Binatia bacterium]|nr:SDR family oxidoreductase [Candidatus Binatia bacterium]